VRLDRYPTFTYKDEIVIHLRGNLKPIIARFLKWEEKDYLKGSYHLVIDCSGETRYIDDWFIGYLNGEPMQVIA